LGARIRVPAAAGVTWPPSSSVTSPPSVRPPARWWNASKWLPRASQRHHRRRPRPDQPDATIALIVPVRPRVAATRRAARLTPLLSHEGIATLLVWPPCWARLLAAFPSAAAGRAGGGPRVVESGTLGNGHRSGGRVDETAAARVAGQGPHDRAAFPGRFEVRSGVTCSFEPALARTWVPCLRYPPGFGATGRAYAEANIASAIPLTPGVWA